MGKEWLRRSRLGKEACDGEELRRAGFLVAGWAGGDEGTGQERACTECIAPGVGVEWEGKSEDSTRWLAALELRDGAV